MPANISDKSTLAAELPRLATLKSGLGHGPVGHLSLVQPTPLVGRTEELETIHRRLTVDGVRLLTLAGPAGVGKTRLALAAAVHVAKNTEHFPYGAVLVDLTPVRDPDLVLGAVARALGLQDVGLRPALERLVDALVERQKLLVVLDNFEHVLPAAASLAELLAACPRLALLVTSRMPLRLRCEHTLRIAPLLVPDLQAALPPLDALLAVASAELLVGRARARRPDFVLSEKYASVVAQLTVQLDGLPLALELAAAQLDVLLLSTLTRRLGDRLRLLASGAPDAPERQCSLEAAVGWSYDLLSAPEQPSEQDASAAEPAEPEDDEPAFSMLETVREYAWERLAAEGELVAARHAHARFFLALAEHPDPLLRRRDQRVWYLRLERELDNLRAALQWLLEQDALDTTAECEASLRLAGALGWFWSARGYHAEGLRWVEQALAHDRTAEIALEANPTAMAAHMRALIGTGEFLAYQGNFELARSVLGEALALARRREDRASIAQALNYLGTCALFAGDATTAVPLQREALDCGRDLHDPHPSGIALFLLGLAATAQGDDVAAVARCEEALGRLEAAGDARFAAHVCFNLAGIVCQQGDLRRAVAIVREGLAACTTLQDRLLLTTGVRAAFALVGERGDATGSARLLGAADALTQAAGATLGVAERVAADRVVAALRDQLTREDIAGAYLDGRTLSFDEVIAQALMLLDEVASAPRR
jgi:predicted ATPase